MEGFGITKEKMRPEDEPGQVKGRRERVNRAQIEVCNMLKEELNGIPERILEKYSFL